MKTLPVLLTLLVLIGCDGGGSKDWTLDPLSDHVTVSDLSSDRFCCEPNKLPQVIGTLTIVNDYPGVSVSIRIGPFTNGVVADVGGTARLGSGEQMTITLSATDCTWATSEGTIRVDGDGLLGTAAFIERSYTITNTCRRDRITTDLEVSGLARAHFDTVGDPSPYGPDPVLYVVGPSTHAGVQAYAIKTAAMTGKITSAPKVHTVGIFVPPIPPNGIGDDVVAVSAGAGLTRALYPFAPPGHARTHWAGTDWGGLAIGGASRDLVSYGGRSRASGVCYTVNAAVVFEEHDPALSFFNGVPVSQNLVGDRNFRNRTGDPATAFVDETNRGVVVVMQGSPGQVWFHDRKDTNAQALLIGVAGNDPRQLRGAGGFLAVSNRGSNSVTLMRWDGANFPFILTDLTRLDGAPIVTPLKLDMITLSNGRRALAVASDTTDRWWIAEIDDLGRVVKQWTGTYGATGGLADVVFLPGPVTYLAVAAKGLRTVKLVETTLVAPPQ